MVREIILFEGAKDDTSDVCLIGVSALNDSCYGSAVLRACCLLLGEDDS